MKGDIESASNEMMFSNGDGITRIVSAWFSVGFSNSTRFQITNNNQKWEKFLI